MFDIVELSLVSTIFCERSAVSPDLHRIMIEVAQKNNQEPHAIPPCTAYIMSSARKLRPCEHYCCRTPSMRATVASLDGAP
jgi:hypothetical protein